MIKEYRPGAAGSRPSSFALNDRAELTMGVGTICWCAPEVLSGSSQYGLPSDVYSFAILLFEIETCRLPYEDIPSVRTIPSLVISGTRPTLPEPIVTRPYAREFREIMAQCWDGEPSKRPAFREVLEVLERLEVDVVLPSFPDDSAKAASQGVPDHAMHSGTHDSNNSKSGKGGSGVDGGQLPSVLPPDVRHRRADKYHTLTPSFSPHSTM
ncbi:hypothetical protein PTSG_04723 [Salpingoeca rosetta]|uniref:Protein kinase domain-containing protein n=1 Tax=Salpingoeca rosetta (strain ATCC 50818 / BSB-021) TaxID=946362 RepID=F2U9I7_SALR5|nr:uncharacterized protein PTSG_04723 [Salpingoeca rosetta]EGD73014.1 hypothetical protein PTSG_04723 [Salpingoeca rosetta]|eukprot:XP_004994045.1 hypothetical protein PTSG_04723 [Salpingoeca rosetta]